MLEFFKSNYKRKSYTSMPQPFHLPDWFWDNFLFLEFWGPNLVTPAQIGALSLHLKARINANYICINKSYQHWAREDGFMLLQLRRVASWLWQCDPPPSPPATPMSSRSLPNKHHPNIPSQLLLFSWVLFLLKNIFAIDRFYLWPL